MFSIINNRKYLFNFCFVLFSFTTADIKRRRGVTSGWVAGGAVDGRARHGSALAPGRSRRGTKPSRRHRAGGSSPAGGAEPPRLRRLQLAFVAGRFRTRLKRITKHGRLLF